MVRFPSAAVSMWVYQSTCNDLKPKKYEYEKKINYKLAYLLHESGHGYHLMRGHVDI